MIPCVWQNNFKGPLEPANSMWQAVGRSPELGLMIVVSGVSLREECFSHHGTVIGGVSIVLLG